MAQPSFDERTQSFLSWFTQLPGATFHPDIQIQDLRARGAGRGIGGSRRGVPGKRER